MRLVESESSFQETLGSQKIDLNSPRSDFLYGQKKVEAIKKRAEGMLLLEAYDTVWKEFGLQKRRQGQRSDLKKAHQPAQVLGCKEKEEEDKNFSSLRPNQDEVMFFSGRSDVFIANILNLASKNDVHSLRKVRKDGNPILIGVMNRRELTPCRTADFIGLPADVQDRLLKKSKEEQVAGIKAWKAHAKQGGKTEKK